MWHWKVKQIRKRHKCIQKNGKPTHEYTHVLHWGRQNHRSMCMKDFVFDIYFNWTGTIIWDAFFRHLNTKYKRVIHFYPFHCIFRHVNPRKRFAMDLPVVAHSSFGIPFALLFNKFFCRAGWRENLPPEFTFHWSNSPKQNIRIYHAVLFVCANNFCVHLLQMTDFIMAF